MTRPVGPVPPVGPTPPVEDRREADRRARDRRAARRALVPVDPSAAAATDETPEAATTPPPPRPGSRPATGPDPALAAQLLGQTGARKGLRGGPPVLDAARSTYLNAQYAGPADRRPPAGTRGKTEI